MNKKVFLVILVLILTITNFILFKNFYNEEMNNEIKQNNYIIEKINIKEY